MGPQDRKDERQHPDEGGTGSGNSGEGASSALEALLRKRQMRVGPPPDPAAPPGTNQEDGTPAKE